MSRVLEVPKYLLSRKSAQWQIRICAGAASFDSLSGCYLTITVISKWREQRFHAVFATFLKSSERQANEMAAHCSWPQRRSRAMHIPLSALHKGWGTQTGDGKPGIKHVPRLERTTQSRLGPKSKSPDRFPLSARTLTSVETGKKSRAGNGFASFLMY